MGRLRHLNIILCFAYQFSFGKAKRNGLKEFQDVLKGER